MSCWVNKYFLITPWTGGNLMDEKTQKTLAKKARTCGAKTKAGTPCRKSPMHNGRCANHGGKSLSGIAHPNYKHGRCTALGR
jgi:hypothetical protein